MHELYIAECILDTAAKALPRDTSNADVRAISVRVGRLDAVQPESLLFLFDAIKAHKGFGHAALEIEEVSIECRCNVCTTQFPLVDELLFVCPECGSSRVTVESGRGIQLTSVTIADKEEAPSENTSSP